MTYVGQRVRRVDAVEKVTGAAVFGSDVALPGMLHGAVLRSPHAHARIVAIDTARAQQAPGVRGVVTGRDFPFTFGASIQDQPFLAIDRVRFVGEPVVAVAADTELQAQEALRPHRRRVRGAAGRPGRPGRPRRGRPARPSRPPRLPAGRP